MTNPEVCIHCGHSREAHVNSGKHPEALHRLSTYETVLSECPGFDSGDRDADVSFEQEELVRAEQAYLDDMRPTSRRTHWD